MHSLQEELDWLFDEAPVARSLREEIETAMAADNAARYPGVDGDLFTFEHLRPAVPADVAFDNSIPIVCLDDAPAWERVGSLAEYRQAAAEAIWAWLPDFAGGLIPAGGCVARLLSRQTLDGSDIDLFPVGISAEGVRAETQRLASHLAARCRPGDVLHVYRTSHCVSFVIASRFPPQLKATALVTIQVILRLYSTISEVLHGFDLGASAVADDGLNLYFTSASRLAFERGLNVLDLSRRRANYEVRAVKYLRRGFAFALPDLCCESFPDELPYLRLSGRKGARGSLVQASHAVATRPGGSPWARDVLNGGGSRGSIRPERVDARLPPSDEGALYAPMQYDCAGGLSDLIRNLQALRLGRREGLKAHALYTQGLDVFALQPSDDIVRIRSELKRKPSRVRKFVYNISPECGSLVSVLIRQTPAAAACICQAAVARLAPQLTIPLHFGSARDSSIALSDLDARIAPSLWYGPHYAPRILAARQPAIFRSTWVQLVGVLTAFVLLDLANIIGSYLGVRDDSVCTICGKNGLALHPPENELPLRAQCLNCAAELCDSGLLSDLDPKSLEQLPPFIPRMCLNRLQPETPQSRTRKQRQRGGTSTAAENKELTPEVVGEAFRMYSTDEAFRVYSGARGLAPEWPQAAEEILEAESIDEVVWINGMHIA